jgi:hypothetical protein
MRRSCRVSFLSLLARRPGRLRTLLPMSDKIPMAGPPAAVPMCSLITDRGNHCSPRMRDRYARMRAFPCTRPGADTTARNRRFRAVSRDAHADEPAGGFGWTSVGDASLIDIHPSQRLSWQCPIGSAPLRGPAPLEVAAGERRGHPGGGIAALRRQLMAAAASTDPPARLPEITTLRGSGLPDRAGGLTATSHHDEPAEHHHESQRAEHPGGCRRPVAARLGRGPRLRG